MDQDFPVSGWQAAWISRELPALWQYSIGLTWVLSGALIFTGLRTFFRQRRTHRELEANPSSRAAILAEHEKYMARAGRRHFAISLVYFVHTLVIVSVDAGVGFAALGAATPQIPWTVPSTSNLLAFFAALATIFGTVVLPMLAAFVLAPLAQVSFVAWLVERRRRRLLLSRGDEHDPARTLADYVPEARIIAGYMAQTWLMLQFFVAAWWPVEPHSSARMLIFMATCGSASVWLDASFAFNFCADRLEEVQLKGLSRGVGGIVRLFGRQVVAVHGGKNAADVLPKYEDAPLLDLVSEKEVV